MARPPASRLHALAALLGLAAVVAGCASVSPDRVTADRMDYGQVIVESWKRQTLLNVVRMRYGDAPVFLDVASVINSYSFTGKANAAASNLPAPPIPKLAFRFRGQSASTMILHESVLTLR